MQIKMQIKIKIKGKLAQSQLVIFSLVLGGDASLRF